MCMYAPPNPLVYYALIVIVSTFIHPSIMMNGKSNERTTIHTYIYTYICAYSYIHISWNTQPFTRLISHLYIHTYTYIRRCVSTHIVIYIHITVTNWTESTRSSRDSFCKCSSLSFDVCICFLHWYLLTYPYS